MVKTTATFYSNIAHRSIFTIFPSWLIASCKLNTLLALRPAAEQLLRHHSEEESDWSDGESETELGKLSQESERQACLQSRRGRLNDDQEREARLKQNLC